MRIRWTRSELLILHPFWEQHETLHLLFRYRGHRTAAQHRQNYLALTRGLTALESRTLPLATTRRSRLEVSCRTASSLFVLALSDEYFDESERQWRKLM